MLRDDLRSHGAKIVFLTDDMSALQTLVSADHYTFSLTTNIRKLTELADCSGCQHNVAYLEMSEQKPCQTKVLYKNKQMNPVHM